MFYQSNETKSTQSCLQKVKNEAPCCCYTHTGTCSCQLFISVPCFTTIILWIVGLVIPEKKVCSIENLWKLCMKRSKNEKKKWERLQGLANVTVSPRGPVLNTCRGLRVCESGRALLVSAFREDYRDFIFSHFHICLCDQLLVDVA